MDEEYLKLKHTAKTLADKLDQIESNESYKGIWSYLHVHGYKYTGPNWEQELKDLKDLL